MVVGLILCRLFEWAQVRLEIIPAEVYKLDHIELDVRVLDLLAIIGVSLVVCFHRHAGAVAAGCQDFAGGRLEVRVNDPRNRIEKSYGQLQILGAWILKW